MESLDVQIVTADTNISLGDDIFLINAGNNNVILTLPNMAGMGFGKIYFFRRTDLNGNNIVIINPTGTTIDGASNLIVGPKQNITLIYKNGEWNITEQMGIRTPFWGRINKSHVAFQAPALNNNIEIFGLPAGWINQGVIIKQSIQFAGTGITNYTLSLGIIGNLTKYATPFSVSTIPSDTNFHVSQNFFMENWGSITSIRAEAISTGANLDQSTQGDVDFYILLSQIK